MKIICLKWGDKFSHEHVNRLYKMICKNYKDDFDFICYTENSSHIDKNIEIRDLDLSDDLEKWWWKLTLFKEIAHKPTMFLDLDVVIQNDITHYKNYVNENKIKTIKAYWKPHARNLPPIEPGFNMDLNSSVILWKGDFRYIWNHFYDDADYYMCKYMGIDSYLYFNHNNTLKYFPRNEIYSRLHGLDENNYWNYGQPKRNLFYDKDYKICIFNKWKMDKVFGGAGIDDDAYIGFEKYWSD